MWLWNEELHEEGFDGRCQVLELSEEDDNLAGVQNLEPQSCDVSKARNPITSSCVAQNK